MNPEYVAERLFNPSLFQDPPAALTHFLDGHSNTMIIPSAAQPDELIAAHEAMVLNQDTTELDGWMLEGSRWRILASKQMCRNAAHIQGMITSPIIQ